MKKNSDVCFLSETFSNREADRETLKLETEQIEKREREEKEIGKRERDR
jgi:hypothetical protein